MYNSTFFMKVSRRIWDFELSDKAKLLYFYLTELRERYTGEHKDYFFHTDEDLAKELGWNIKTLKSAKAELKNTDLVKFSKVHWYTDSTHKKLSKKYVTGYRIPLLPKD